jgi:hypothetical protein
MPKTSQAALLQDSERLLRTVETSEGELAGVASYRAALERAYSQAVSARVRRDALVASAQVETVQVNQALAACTEAARSLRHYLKSVLGSRNPKLTRYGIQPLRKRGRFLTRPPAGCELPS